MSYLNIRINLSFYLINSFASLKVFRIAFELYNIFNISISIEIVL